MNKEKKMKPDFTDMSGDQFLITPEVAQAQVSAANFPEYQNIEPIPTSLEMKAVQKDIDTKMLKEITIDEKIKEDVKTIQRKMDPIPKSSIDKLKELVALGSLEKDVEVFGHIWTLRALDQTDKTNAYEESDNIASQAGRIPALMMTTVAHAIEKLDGVSVYSWFPDIKLEDYKSNRYAYAGAVRRAVTRYLEPQADFVIEMLYSEYLKIESERNKVLSELKNS
jgi:hypothetical protein